jgi:peroxisomal 2,4-dienoyl-CoA reductase
MEIDVLGTFNTLKATVPYLIESAARNPNPSVDGLTGGRILYVSANFHYTGMPLQAHVSSAKAAIDALMASVSLEYGPYGVTSNVIAPGGIENTEGMARLSSSKSTQADKAASVPLGRWGTCRDIADATVYLFSDTGNYVNGEVLVVDGAAWRLKTGTGPGLDSGMRYPDFLMSGDISKHLKDGRKDKSKL